MEHTGNKGSRKLREATFRALSQGTRPAHRPSAPLTGLCLGDWLCAGHFALVQGPARNAPRWSWPRCWQACAPSVGKRCQARECPLRAGHWADTSDVPAAAANTTKGSTVCQAPSQATQSQSCVLFCTSCWFTLVGLLRFRVFKQLAQYQHLSPS